MDRKEFIIKGGLFAFAITTSINCVTKEKTEKEVNNKVNCDETTNDILGPFYRENAPKRNNIRLESDTKNLLIVKGKLLANDCSTPLINQEIDFWQANHDGSYDNESSDYLYRAKVVTDNNGNYQLKTIIPGRYLNGNQFRPSHIHIRIKTEDKELISQIYFKEDPYIDKDPWASQNKAQNRILPLKSIGLNEQQVELDIIV